MAQTRTKRYSSPRRWIFFVKVAYSHADQTVAGRINTNGDAEKGFAFYYCGRRAVPVAGEPKRRKSICVGSTRYRWRIVAFVCGYVRSARKWLLLPTMLKRLYDARRGRSVYPAGISTGLEAGREEQAVRVGRGRGDGDGQNVNVADMGVTFHEKWYNFFMKRLYPAFLSLLHSRSDWKASR